MQSRLIQLFYLPKARKVDKNDKLLPVNLLFFNTYIALIIIVYILLIVFSGLCFMFERLLKLTNKNTILFLLMGYFNLQKLVAKYKLSFLTSRKNTLELHETKAHIDVNYVDHKTTC